MPSAGPLHLGLSGPLDAEASGALRRQLSAAFAVGVTTLVLDLSEVTDCDSTGLGVLRGASEHLRRRAGSLVVVHPCPRVLTALRVNGLGHLVQPERPALRLVSAPAPPAEDEPGRGRRSLSAT